MDQMVWVFTKRLYALQIPWKHSVAFALQYVNSYPIFVIATLNIETNHLQAEMHLSLKASQ